MLLGGSLAVLQRTIYNLTRVDNNNTFGGCNVTTDIDRIDIQALKLIFVNKIDFFQNTIFTTFQNTIFIKRSF